MLGLLILAFCFFWGFILTSFFLPFFKKTPFFLPASFFLGLLWSASFIFLLKMNLNLFFLVSFVFVIFFLRKVKLSFGFSVGLFALFFIFSFWFFNRTFRYQDNFLLVASNEYLDFGAHIPLIRSFSKGNNFPPQLPFYAGKPIFYYFLFDFATGVFEKSGWSIAFAYNLLSALSLAFLFIFIFYFSQKIYQQKDWRIGILSCLLAFFTPNLSFLYFFKKNGFNNFFTNLRNHNFYLDNGLTIDKFFGGFFNINVFTNQRHLVFGFGIFFIFILLLAQLAKKNLDLKTIIFSGLSLGILPFWHNFVFLAIFLVYITAFIFFKQKKIILLILLIGFVTALPQLWFIRLNTQNQIFFRPGFLIWDNLTIFNFVKFWFYNFGFGLPAIIFGFWLSPIRVKKLFLPIFALFLIPNIFSFAKEPFNDHKFFCLLAVFTAMLSARFLLFLWQKNRVFALVFFVLLTASGALDFLVIKNDVWVRFQDIQCEPFLTWIEKNTQPSDVFFTNLGIWDPVNLTGRRTFLGRPHYIWAYGADPTERMVEKSEVLKGQQKEKIKAILNKNKIKFLAFKKDGEIFNQPFFAKNFNLVYQDNIWSVYRVSE